MCQFLDKEKAMPEEQLSQTKEKFQKPIYKVWWFWVFVIFIILLVSSGGEKKETPPIEQTTEIKQEAIQPQKSEPFLELSEITKGLNNTEVMLSKIVVEGKTDVGAKVKINNQEVAVDENGNFKDIVELSVGKNKIRIVADNGYKQKEITLNIKRLGEKEIAERQSGYVSKQSVNWTDNIPQWVKDKLTSEQLKEFINLINKTSPEFRQTFVSDYAKELAQQNKVIALGVWANSLDLSINYQMDDAWEIVERIKRKTNDFAYYRDEIKFLEFIVTVTNKIEGQKEYQKFLENLLKAF
jgi:hypothetical protein